MDAPRRPGAGFRSCCSWSRPISGWDSFVERELAADGVAAADYALLSLVGVRGPARLTEVAGELGMPLTTASDAVRRLERRNTRRACRTLTTGVRCSSP